MRKIYQNLIMAIIVISFAAAILPGCAENRYYHRYHHHRHVWYQRHHRPVPAGVNFEMDVR